MMLKIDCAGERLALLAEKAVFWPRERAMIIADLHLGKPAAFRRAGVAVPEATTLGDLERLDKILRETDSRRLIVLGDFFHTRAGLQPEMLDTVAAWREQNAALEIILIPGNHDRKSGSPPALWRVLETEECWSRPPFLFCHEPHAEPESYMLSGHLHPAIVLREAYGGGVRAPCFCFGKRSAILPAFGSFTGMSNLQPQRGDRIFAISRVDNEVMELTVPSR
jgi:DNA ligase-associated metallophosphoesterase